MGSFLQRFPYEIFYVIAIIANVVLAFFYRKKLDLKQVSLSISIGVFSINALFLGLCAIINKFLFNSINLKFLISIFMLFFILSTYKLIKKEKLKSTLLNVIILSIALFSSLILNIKHVFLIYLLLELVVFCIYQYMSFLRNSRKDIYSMIFLLISASASFMFLGFYIIWLIVKNLPCQVLLQTCMAMAVLLKIGIFPFYNYLMQNNRKQNIIQAILFYCYLPFIGVIAFNKLCAVAFYTNGIFAIILGTFIFVCLMVYAINAYKTNDAVKFISHTSCIFASIAILNCALRGANVLSVRLVSFSSFLILALFALAAIIKINCKIPKITFLSLKGIGINNKAFTLLFSCILLILTCVIPSGHSLCLGNILKNICLSDKTAIFLLAGIIISGVLVFSKTLKTVQNFYCINKHFELECFHKKTTYNYVVSMIIIAFILISLFL